MLESALQATTGSPLPRLPRDWARPSHVCPGTGLAPPTSAPGLGSPLPRLPRDWARPAHICTWDCARPSHVCTGTGLTPATSAPGLGATRLLAAPAGARATPATLRPRRAGGRAGAPTGQAAQVSPVVECMPAAHASQRREFASVTVLRVAAAGVRIRRAVAAAGLRIRRAVAAAGVRIRRAAAAATCARACTA
jgi:hypothetical protein